jgi:methionine-R-sulfoxide reductase
MKIKLLISLFFFISRLFSEENLELIFIYNAKSGVVNELIDFAHKIVSPETYDCNLCAISYGAFSMKKKWSTYIETLPFKSTFTYKDKFSKNGYSNIKFPSVFIRSNEKLDEIISATEINEIKNLDQLIGLLNQKLYQQGIDMKKQKKNELTEEEWKKKLTPEEFHILREKGTERPFTGEYDKFYKDGTYKCAGCGTELFTSSSKYDSGCGWPAFYEAMPEKIQESADNSFGMTRVEITCENCGGHLGHVFNDGPQPSGLRYCVNSISLDFDSKDNDD